ncbi:sugar phosphate nucleotidyltransferase [Bizionia sp.]|uniref:sugar phosphate nucleotidyltransferase n=1 Tax=Bizionia sp. TaxID=1954480 RepID=UPI003A945235
MVKKTLAIMAAGMGSRFGSLKQIQPVYGNFSIMDFSIYDAIQVGYNHIVFIVRDEIVELFKDRYANKLPKHVSLDFVIQKNDLSDSRTRKKPWGTGHALLALKKTVTTDFTLINADDFYGRNAFQLMHDALFKDTNLNHYLVAYALKNTLSDNGTVSRGICHVDKNQNLISIEELTAIMKNDAGEIISQTNLMSETLNPNSLVSMNFWGFKQSVFNVANDLFLKFLHTITDFEKDEFYITYIIKHLIENSPNSIKVLATDSSWFGMTYSADETSARENIQTHIDSNFYPKKLW